MVLQPIRSKVLMAGAAAVLVASLAGGAFAQAPQGGPRRPGGGPLGRLGGGPGGPGGGPMRPGPGGLPLGQLNLTEQQQTQVRDVMERYQPDMMAAATRVREAADAQRKAVEAVPLNEGLVRSTSDALGNAQRDVALIQAQTHNEIYNLLTEDQKAKLKEILAQRESRMGKRQEQMQQRLKQRRDAK